MKAIKRYLNKLFPDEKTLLRQKEETIKDLSETQKNLTAEGIEKLKENTELDEKYIKKLLERKQRKEERKIDKLDKKLDKIHERTL
ncbi:MAG: hypothetical protein IJ837_03055 [Clostridia bacterium]|nr:hypothetical protein [Clostridia bacterium]